MAKKPLNKKSPKAGKKPVKRKPPKKKMPNGLTIKQEKFCHVYMETGNASEAYRQVYSCGRMKETTIYVKASELLKSGKITVRVHQLQDDLREVSDIKKEKVLYQLESILEANITDYLEFDGEKVTFKAFNKLTQKQLYAIEGIKQNEKGEVELKLHGKSWTTDRINKMLGYEAAKKIDLEGVEMGILYLPDRNE